MQVISVNVGMPRDVPYRDRTVRTGIYKSSVTQRITLRSTHVAGDGQADPENHGGVHMACYAYPVEHYDFWCRALGRDAMPWGQFGENLTIAGLTEADIRIGDVLKIGSAVVQVSEPRIPCFKLVMRMEAGADFAARFHKSGRLGFYMRILKEGDVGAGDAIRIIDRAEGSVTMADFIAVSQFDNRNVGELQRVLSARNLPPKWIATIASHIQTARTGSRELAVSSAVLNSSL